jgi:uncharacterized RDD family membrane protein YckC
VSGRKARRARAAEEEAISATAPELRYPGLFRRLAALLYDALLALAVVLIASLPIVIVNRGQAVPAGDPLYQTFLFFLVFFYFAWHWVRIGQTLGMKAWRLRVTLEDGSPITWWHALLRFLVGLVSLALLGLGFFWMLLDPRRRAWHDRASETVVIDTSPPKR